MRNGSGYVAPMTQLILIRHGQASFGQRNYDKLSERGHQQARIAGKALNDQGLTFDALISGDMARQKATAEEAAAQMQSPPELQTRPEFNEYSAESLFAAYMPSVLAENPDLAAKNKALFTDPRLFQTTLAIITRKWLADEPHTINSLESWPQFCARVRNGLAAIHRDFGRDARIGVFTSGGPIAVAVGSAQEVTDDMIIQINWGVFNASLHEFQSNKSGWRLTGFNNISHLRQVEEPGIVTLR